MWINTQGSRLMNLDHIATIWVDCDVSQPINPKFILKCTNCHGEEKVIYQGREKEVYEHYEELIRRIEMHDLSESIV